MLSIIQSIFGLYAPITYNEINYYYDPVAQTLYQYTNVVVPSGASGVNWEWIAGVALFAIAFYSIFRLIGVVLSGK